MSSSASLYSPTSSGSFRKSSIERSAFGGQKLSIELLPNQSIFRETFLGTAVPRLVSPVRTPTDEDGPRSPSGGDEAMSPGCTACHALSSSPVLRKTSQPALKRHAVILPTRHHSPYCRMPTGTRALPALPSIGEDCLMEWERKGSMAVAINLPSPATTPGRSPFYTTSTYRSSSSSPTSSATYGKTIHEQEEEDDDDHRDGYFASLPPPVSRFSVDTVATEVAPLTALPSPRFHFHPAAGRAQSVMLGRPATPVSPTRDYRAFLRMS